MMMMMMMMMMMITIFWGRGPRLASDFIFSFSLIRKSVRSRTCEKKWMGSYCWRKISCTSWYGSSTIIYEFYTCQMVQDFFHQQYGQHLLCIGCNYRPYKTGASPTQYFVSWNEFQNVLNVYFYKGWFPNIQGKGIVDPKTWIIGIHNLARSVVWLFFWGLMRLRRRDFLSSQIIPTKQPSCQYDWMSVWNSPVNYQT